MKGMSSKFVIILLAILFITSCGTPTPGSGQTSSIQVAGFDDKGEIQNDYSVTKSFDNCAGPGDATYGVSVFESSEIQNSQELVLTGEVSGGASIPETAEISIKAALESHFSADRKTVSGKGESLEIEIPAHTNSAYTFTWSEVRKQGEISYIEDKELKHAKYDYRVRIDYVSSKAENIPSCSSGSVIPATSVVISDFKPGEDWISNCISDTTWSFYPSTNLAVDAEGCFEQPIIPGNFYTSNGRLRIRYTGTLQTAQNYGFFAPIDNNNSTIVVSMDIDTLKTSRLIIGLFSRPDFSADGYLILTAPNQIEPQTFSLRSSNLSSKEKTVYPNVPGAKGNYEIEIVLTPGDFSVKLQQIYHLVDNLSLNYSKRYLYIGIRPEPGLSDIDANISVTVSP